MIVDLLKLEKAGSVPNAIYGIVEIKKWALSAARNPRILGRRRPYELGVLARSAYLILIDDVDDDRWFLNPFID